MNLNGKKTKGKTSASGTSSENVSQTTNQENNTSRAGGFDTNSAGSSSVTFGEQGQSLLDTLTAKFTGGQDTTGRDTLSSLATNGGINPFVDQAITQSNDEAGRMHDQTQAGIRSGNFRGGAAADMFGQADASGNFFSRLAGQNANTRVGAFDSAENRRLGAAGQLGGIESQDTGMATNILSFLRGQDTTQDSNGTTFEDIVSLLNGLSTGTANKKFDTQGKTSGTEFGGSIDFPMPS